MEFKDGTHVFTFEGKDVGGLQRVVIDPETNEVTHIVIKKGLLAASDTVVALEHVASASEKEINLNCTANDIEEMVPLDIEQKLPANERIEEDPKYLPLAGGMYTTPITEPYFNVQIKRTIPENLLALKEGARVMSWDDEHVGNIERVDTDPENCRVTQFVVVRGLLAKVRKSIPAQWVKMINDDEVQLTIGTQQFDELPEKEG